ncbi:uncharacterized protein LOC115630741 [Scaptodrosophila lebanonensis]|uniref:Uncharacterized protein LOC115630741 n=1 Tax=Drosophila lebanonensis TaxID=7225 RepID=A0A6J2U6V2_DROLE|nr:uncharacterized protein LOC115630741 [Scaptodrosophila lebanonensis]
MPRSTKKSDIGNTSTRFNAALSTSSSSAETTPTTGSRPRKRRRLDKESQDRRSKSRESKFGECNIEDAKQIDRRLRKVARDNSISHEDMHKVVRRVVRNDHVLALVSLKAEDEVAREKREAEKRGAIIITDTPSGEKLTRAKARELNRTPGIALPALSESPATNGIEVLIREDLHSDEEDEEYTFKEDDFHSDEDPNTTASEIDSNPCTPQTPLATTEAEDSPIKFSADGCFKVPLDKNQEPGQDLRIATRTRSKLCLEQTTIEDLQSEFVPPDVELCDVPEYDMTANDEEWMQFLNDFSKPLNNSFLGDDDDPINDPEYVAAEKIPVDAEELRDVNISKKELTDLVSELFEGLLQEGVSLESIELETPQKFLSENQNSITSLTLPQTVEQVTRQIDFDTQSSVVRSDVVDTTAVFPPMGQDSFHPHVMSTPSTTDGPNLVPMTIFESCGLNNSMDTNVMNNTCKVVGIATTALTQTSDLIAVPLPGQPNCFQLAKVIAHNEHGNQCLDVVQLPLAEQGASMTAEPEFLMPAEPADPEPAKLVGPDNAPKADDRYSTPYDTNFTWEYISVRKHIYNEYSDYFESLRNLKPVPPEGTQNNIEGFTHHQHELLQQQLRIHTQMLTQTFLQTYSNPKLYHMAKQPKQMLYELQEKANQNSNFNCWNLKAAVKLVDKWERDLSSDEFEKENKKMMEFINKEIQLTDGRTRQVPRLAPRIMDLMLDSTVFMYPQYLPRMAFQPRSVQFTAYAPSEYQLIAMGLEKHLNVINSSKKPLRKRVDPISIACNRMAKDTVHGKQGRRLYWKIKELRDGKEYNPVKYYLDHGLAPPVQQILLGFEGGIVRPPRERYHELHSGWKFYIEKTWNKRRRRRAPNLSKASAQASASYLEFVREAIGEDLLLPENFGEAAAPHGSATGLALAQKNDQATEPTENTVATEKARSKSNIQNSSKFEACKHQHQPTSLTINVNYVFGGGLATNLCGAGISVPYQHGTYDDNVVTINRSLHTSKESDLLALPPPPPPLPDDAGPCVNLRFDSATNSLQINEIENSASTYQSQEITTLTNDTKSLGCARKARFSIFKPKVHTRKRQAKNRGTPSKFSSDQSLSSPISPPTRSRFHVLRQRLRHKLQKRCYSLIRSYGIYLQNQRERYSHTKVVQPYYRHFLALELYTRLLVDLSMFCRSKLSNPVTITSPSSSNAAAQQHQQQQKRQRIVGNNNNTSSNNIEDESLAAGARIRKANRQEEMLRHMLQPDSADENNRKDATFAYNFYEKVEEALLTANRVEDCQKFNQLLQSFDPRHDKVAELYLKVEKLLLPDNPELAEVFLNFLLPAEAAELGKFFEYFMITNATNFINKLNIYFCKQPAQIRKIYACLSELAELPSVSMKKVESKILPLLKGNQFLCDWFMQQFPQAKPPERLLPSVETINLHEVKNNATGEYVETISELLESPTQEQAPGCQLRYINGRIFYGSKILLPAKLSFMAASIYNDQSQKEQDTGAGASNLNCVHSVRHQGEKQISAAAAVDSDDNERSEEDDASRALVIDTTGDEENSCSSIEMCDDMMLRAHAVRLNSGYYGNNCFSNTATSTPNVGNSHASGHHANAKKTSINFGDMSPRKQSGLNNSPMSGLSPLPPVNGVNGATSTQISPQQEKRKSPTKKVRSPQGQTNSRLRCNLPPMVVIHDQEHQHQRPQISSPASPAIECAKRLKTLIDQESTREELDNKANISIIATAKQPLELQSGASSRIAKIEVETEEDQEFLPETGSDNDSSIVSLSQQTFPAIKMDAPLSEDEMEPLVVRGGSTPQHAITTQFDSDEDCKLDVVATLANCAQQGEQNSPSVTTTKATVNTAASGSASTPSLPPATVPQSTSTAWTREEDKIILIEMKLGARDRDYLIRRISTKLRHRTLPELRSRHQFLMDFLSKLQGKT